MAKLSAVHSAETSATAGEEISVAMTTYNGARYVAEQLRSIIIQTRPPTEIVVCDDGSTDGTPEVVDAIAQTSPVPIKSYRNLNNLGFVENFFQAAARTTAPYIAFSDQDDIWHPEKLQRCMAAIREHNAVMAAHSARLIDVTGRVVGDMRPVIGTQVIHPCTLDAWKIFWGLSQIFDRTLLDRLPNDRATRGADSNDPNRPVGHDEWTTFLASCFGTIVVVDEPLVDYRQHASNVYGFRERTLLERIRAKITEEQPRVRRVAWLADLALHRLQVLEMAGVGRADFAAPIAHWRRIHAYCAARREMVSSPSVLRRISLFGANILRGTYGSPKHGGLGRRRFLEDAVMGVLNISGKIQG